jgi:hypothetical protein
MKNCFFLFLFLLPPLILLLFPFFILLFPGCLIAFYAILGQFPTTAGKLLLFIPSEYELSAAAATDQLLGLWSCRWIIRYYISYIIFTSYSLSVCKNNITPVKVCVYYLQPAS